MVSQSRRTKSRHRSIQPGVDDRGDGCRDGVAEDDVEAVKWYRKAADQNLALAQYNLGVCYDRGDGVAEDHAEAAKWYRKAAVQNDADAQYNFSHLLRTRRRRGGGLGRGLQVAVAGSEASAMRLLRNT